MTHLIIHNNESLCREYLLGQLTFNLGKEFNSISQLQKNPDIHSIEKTKSDLIGIDEVKQLQKELIYRPFVEKYQVGIIFYSQNLTAEAQNALLKTLEEKSEETLFYLLVNNEKNLLETVVSRCVKHFVKNSTEQSEEEGSTEETVRPGLLDLPIYQQIAEVEQLTEGEKENPGAIHDLLASIYRYFRVELKESIGRNDTQQIEKINLILQELQKGSERISKNVNKRLTVENILLQIRKLEKFS